MKKNTNKILHNIEEYYTKKINAFGKTPKGVDWKDEETQIIRFKQLLKIIDNNKEFSINDLGCGYGTLLEYMNKNSFFNFQYNGYDLSKKMIEYAKDIEVDNTNCKFSLIKHPDEIVLSDYTIASGIFNVKMEHGEFEWLSYILETIHEMNKKSTKGFSFNILTKYSDKEFMRDDLYYADPLFFFDYCKRNYSKNVSLIHDYNLYEFTILVKK